MRFVKARTEEGSRIGVVQADGSVALAGDVTALEPYLGDDGARLQDLGAAIVAAPATIALYADLDLVAPVQPVSMRDFMVFEEHVLPAWQNLPGWESDRLPDVWYEQPLGYFSNAASLRGPTEAVAVPGGCARLDFELEIGAILGREARSVTPENAAAHVAGFLVLCDWSARDLQLREMEGRLGPFKGKDFASSLGPILITPDELEGRRKGAGYDLTMTAAVNDRTLGTDLWSSAYWSFEELISFSSWDSVVEQGALIGSGTCQGGCILELSLRHGPEGYEFLQPGDQVTLSVEMMGEIRAGITAATNPAWPGERTIPAAGPADR